MSRSERKRLRIGLMLRAIDERGGIGVYTRYLTEELLARHEEHEYVLFYRNPANLGRFAGRPRVRERVLSAPNKALWDQVAVPYACWRERTDVVFHPKFTVPFLAPCKTVMTVHGADWFIPEQARFYHRLDVAYIRTVMPLYFRRASAVISVSQLTTDEFNRILGLPSGKITTIYLAPGKHFRRIDDRETLDRARRRYGLPDRFILTLGKAGDGGRKNTANVLASYALIHESVGYPLVVLGGGGEQLRREYGVPVEGYGKDVVFPGWIEQEDLPAVYSMARLYLYPSNLEAFPIPVTEAMACGTPVITSNVNGLAEIAGSAAVLVDPNDPAGIADAVRRVLSDEALRNDLTAAGLRRSAAFDWGRTADQTMDVLERIATRSSRRVR